VKYFPATFPSLTKGILDLLFSTFFIPVGLLLAMSIRLGLTPPRESPSLVWGTDPIPNFAFWSAAMKKNGWKSETWTTKPYSISQRSDWDHVMGESARFVPDFLRYHLAFLAALVRYDIFFVSFRGFFLGGSASWRAQAFLLKVARRKVVVLPYGADAYNYASVFSPSTSHALMTSYPEAARRGRSISKQVEYWVKNADVVIPGFMSMDGIGRWDVLTPSPLAIDLEKWPQKKPKSGVNNGVTGAVRITHTPNHRGFKGTEFVLAAVEALKSEGLQIDLTLLEGVSNMRVREVLLNETDILVEQLVFTGYALSGIEGMASGLPTVSNLEDSDSLLLFRRWSFLEECPLVSGSPENITDVLRTLVTRPDLRLELGAAGRKYVEKYHGFDSSQFLFEKVICYLATGDRKTLSNLYHPILGAYTKRSPSITHPLNRNQIPDQMMVRKV
jgi:hypothetical protein